MVDIPLTVAPYGPSVAQPGGVIYDQDGTLIWSAAANGYSETRQFSVQQYKGESVLTMWQGEINDKGYGWGYHLILDTSYQVWLFVGGKRFRPERLS